MSGKEGIGRGSRGRSVPGLPKGPIRRSGKGGQLNFKNAPPVTVENPLLKVVLAVLAISPYIAISVVVINTGLPVLGAIMLSIPLFLLISFRVIYKMSQ